jgi:hypothetical protein
LRQLLIIYQDQAFLSLHDIHSCHVCSEAEPYFAILAIPQD